MNKLKNLLSQTSTLLKNYEKLMKVTGENFNIFSVMGMESNEVKTHSAILGELLNPKGSHGLEDIPLKLFIEQLKLRLNEFDDDIIEKFSLDTNASYSKVEESAGTINEDKTEGGRMDIVIKDNRNKVIVIENKIYAGEQENQLLRYKNKYPDGLILYLTLPGDKPSSVGEEMKLNEDYFLLSYKEDILEWLEKCLKEAVRFPMLREVLQQYIYLIKKLTHQTTNNKMAEEIKAIIKENYLEASEINKNFKNVQLEILDGFWKKLAMKIEDELEKKKEYDWDVKVDRFTYNSCKYLTITKKSSIGKCYFYFRYSTNNFETLKGIMIDLKYLTESKEIRGTSIKDDLKLGDFKSGKTSIIYSKITSINIKNDETIAKIIAENQKDDTPLLQDFANEIVNYIDENKERFEKIFNYMSEKESKKTEKV